MQMFDPCHPGELLREEMGSDMTVTRLAELVGVTRAQMSMILNGRAGVSALMSLKLDELFGKSEGFYFRVQQGFDLAQARREKVRLAGLTRQKPVRKSHPDFEKSTIYVHKDTKKAAWRKWEGSNGGDFSQLVEQLLRSYVAPQPKQGPSLRQHQAKAA